LVVADNPVLLAIDTSTEMTGIALYSGARVSELTWHSGRNQTVSLLDQVRHLLEINRLGLDRVGAVAVATGPGTFNGLRVGLSTAKGLGYGRTIPVYGVGTLDATAYPHRSSTLPIRAFVPAGRGRVVFCDFRERNGRWVRVGDLQNRLFGELTEGLTEKTLLAGEIPANADSELLNAPNVELPELALRTRRPGFVAEIAWMRWQSGDDDELAVLEPAYVHGTRPGT
jgi:tRNA threonylcarbamoyladenosine biosynthesis protein TsaB